MSAIEKEVDIDNEEEVIPFPYIMATLNDITNMLYNGEYINNLTHQTKFNSLILNSMYDNKYLFTLQEFKDILLAEIITTPEFANETCKNIESAVNYYLIDLLQKEWLPVITQTCKHIGDLPQVEQRSPEWFTLRKGVITASEAGYLLGLKGPAKCIETIKTKTGVIKSKQLAGNAAIDHGVAYEDVTKRIYELRYNVSVTEYGIIKSPDTDFIGASPDGIVTHSNKPTEFDSLSRVGRMVEIKCPYSRLIDNTIMKEYGVQIQQQLYTCKLPICDFIEATIFDIDCKPVTGKPSAYISLDDMLNDTLSDKTPEHDNIIQNRNIPRGNLTANGTEKGAIVTFKKVVAADDIRTTTNIYPIEKPYDRDEILNWQEETIAEMAEKGWKFVEHKYWRIEVFDVKTVLYNQQLFEDEYIPRLKNIWDIVGRCRELIIADNNDVTNAGKYISGLSRMDLMLDGDCEKYEYGGRLNKRQSSNVTYVMDDVSTIKKSVPKKNTGGASASAITSTLENNTVKTDNSNVTNLSTMAKNESIDDFLSNF